MASTERAQVLVEYVAVLPVLIMCAAACLQGLLIGLGGIMAQEVADRAARGATRAESLASVPASWRSRVTIFTAGQHVRVEIRVPSVLPGVSNVPLHIEVATP